MTVLRRADVWRFDNPRQLMAFLGLVPFERSTGESVQRGGLTLAGNRRARRVLVDRLQHDEARCLWPACDDVCSAFGVHHTRAARSWRSRSPPLPTALTHGRSCWQGGQEADRSPAGSRCDYARQRSRHVPSCSGACFVCSSQPATSRGSRCCT